MNLTSSSAAATIAIRRKKLIRGFREAGALDPAHATTPQALGLRRSWIFNQMIEHRVFLPTGDGRFFLDGQAAAEFLRQRRIRALVLGAVVMVLFFLFWALYGFYR